MALVITIREYETLYIGEDISIDFQRKGHGYRLKIEAPGLRVERKSRLDKKTMEDHSIPQDRNGNK